MYIFSDILGQISRRLTMAFSGCRFQQLPTQTGIIHIIRSIPLNTKCTCVKDCVPIMIFATLIDFVPDFISFNIIDTD